MSDDDPAAPADVRIEAGPGGRARVEIDGADVTRFVTSIGFDATPDETRLVIEGAGSLTAALRKLDVEVVRVPVLGPAELALLRAAQVAFDPDAPERLRYRRLIEKLESVAVD